MAHVTNRVLILNKRLYKRYGNYRNKTSKWILCQPLARIKLKTNIRQINPTAKLYACSQMIQIGKIHINGTNTSWIK